MNERMVSGVLRGLSLLNSSPGAAWMSCFVAAAAPALARMHPRQLHTTYSAVVDLELRLAEGWGYDFKELLAPLLEQQQQQQSGVPPPGAPHAGH